MLIGVGLLVSVAFFSALIDRVAAGEEIVIAKGDKPVAMLVPIRDRLEPRRPVRVLKGDWDEALWREGDAEIEAMFDEATEQPL